MKNEKPVEDTIDDIAAKSWVFSYPFRIDGVWYTKTKPEYRAFAEMVVRECAKACRKNSWIALTADQRARQILDHFGVKE